MTQSRSIATIGSRLLPADLTRSEGRQLAREQNREVSRGLVTATRVQAAGFVAATGLQAAAMLSREAVFQADGDPATANRLNFIVDQFANYVGNEVARFGR